ncbi:MAG TPA: hypothetical protein H9664_04420 [Firmicutes bacterium]|nr:hypothetical protein [Bacillota bacterium]
MIEVSDAWKENQRRLLADRVGLCIKVYNGLEYVARIADTPLPVGESAPSINITNILKMSYLSSCGEYSLDTPQLTVDLQLSNMDGSGEALWEQLSVWEQSSTLVRWDIYAVYSTSNLYESHLLAALVMYNKSLSDNENIITVNLAPIFALVRENMFIPDMADLVNTSDLNDGYQYDIITIINEINESNIAPAAVSYQPSYPSALIMRKPFKQHKIGDAVQIISNSYRFWMRYALLTFDTFMLTNLLVYDPDTPYTIPHSDYIIGEKVMYSYPVENVQEARTFILETPEYSSRTEGQTSFSIVTPTVKPYSKIWMDFPQIVADPARFYINVPIALQLTRLGVAGCELANNSDSAVSDVEISLAGFFSEAYEQTYMPEDALEAMKIHTVYNELGINNQPAGSPVISLDGPSYEVSFRADPRLECGDCVVLDTKRKKIMARVLKIKYEYDGAWKGTAALRYVQDIAPLALIADDTMFLTNALT